MPIWSNYDFNSIVYNKDINMLKNLKFFIIDCLRYEPHYSHYNLNDIIKIVNIIKPKKTILTNLNNDMDYNQLIKKLPKKIVPAYDGMTLEI